MNALKYSAAAFALLCASSIAYAEDSTTTTKPQVGTSEECPAAGTVAEADLSAECKVKAGLSSTEETQSNSSAVTTDTSTTSTGTSTTTMTPATGTMSNALLASQFMGQTVYSTANESVGEINDLVLNKELDTITAIVGVGGFLGIGEKDVAIPVDQITAAKDENNNLHLTISATKEQLEAAPAFDRTVLN